MNIARILILVLAGVAAVVAAIFVRGAMQPSSERPAIVEQPQAPAAQVLAARRELQVGERVQPADLYWQAWPEDALSPAYVVQTSQPDAMNAFAGAVVRAPIAQGEPVSDRKLVQSGQSGFMAAVILPGMRAVAVPTSARAGAGGFILPNDRVDVIVALEENDRYTARTMVENVRVLAIDQSYSESGDGAVVGSTATLELTPAQAEEVALAVSIGEISLSLRSVADNGDFGGGEGLRDRPEIGQAPEGRVVRVIRYGQEQRVALGGNG